jgi:hypothetical protein
MLRLKNRQLQIPGGMGFYLPELKWSARKGSSFHSIADQLERVILANKALAIKNRWPRARKDIEDWVDAYNATVCARMGWDHYIMPSGSTSTPKSDSRHLQETLRSLSAAAAKAKELVAGARTLMEWEDSGDPPVPPELALKRAIICANCPLNDPGDLTKWFTVPAAELIRRRIARAQSRNLTTVRDDQLHTCMACSCPLKLKVHVPINWVVKELPPARRARLHDSCWILAES